MTLSDDTNLEVPVPIMTDQVLTDVFDTPVHVITTEDGPLASYF